MSKYKAVKSEADGMCSVNKCGLKVMSRRLCRKHYQRWWRHGSPLAGRVENGEAHKFLEEIAILFSGEECLPWPFGKISTGYGCIRKDSRTQLVHRLVCEERHGLAPSDKHEAGHRCGNRICCNPNHLRWITGSENQMDRVAHGTHCRGSRAYNSKINEYSAREILELRGALSQSELAKKYGVSRSTISDLQSGRTWAWL